MTQTMTTMSRRIGATVDNGIALNFGAAMIAGLVTTTISTPADFVKSIMMNGKGGNQGPVAIVNSIMVI